MSVQLTRGDFEALLWDHLHNVLSDGVTSELLDALGITWSQWSAFSDGEVAELRAALDLVRSETGRNVWQKEGDPR